MAEAGSFQHHCVADLAWAVSSPPLLLHQQNDCAWFSGNWYLEQYRQIEAELRKLDRDTLKLQSLLSAQKDQRLGNYFETLWTYALELNPRYRLIERNLQVIDGDRTLGEMDFIVLDTETGRYAHWELAIKFYLGIGDTIRHDAWHGPGKKDRLDLKVDHLLSRQTLLSTHPVARELLKERGIEIRDCAVILKGRLFYPWQQYRPEYYPQFANPGHLAGRWLTRQQLLHSFGADTRLVPLVGSGWMSRVSTDWESGAYSIHELLRLIDSGFLRLPLHVLTDEADAERLFIVDDNWPSYKT